MLGTERFQCDTQFHGSTAVDGYKLVVLQLDHITVDTCNDAGYSAQLTGLVGKQYGYGEDTVS